MRSCISGVVAVVVCTLWVGGSLLAWTTPVAVSNTSLNASNARIARGSSGAVHVTYYDGNWRICYRYRNGYGVFGPIETVSSVFSFRPDVIEDSQGRPHVVYPGEVVKDVNNDLFEAVKDNGVWTTTHVTYSDNSMEDEPRLGLDSTGRIHLVYTKGNDVMYRVKTNGVWSDEIYIGTCGNSYYQRPDLSVDPSDNLHVVWADSTHVYYRKCTAGAWGSVRTIMTSSDFIAFPRVAGTTANQVVAVTFDQSYGGHLEFTFSNDGGNGWVGQQYLTPGHWPNMDTDGQGNAYLGFTDLSNNSCAGYMRWTGIGWTPIVDPAPTGNWQGWADVACGTDGVVSMVWDEGTSPSRISLSVSIPPSDPTPPTSPAPVIDDGAVQTIPTYLHAKWSPSSDPETAIDRYEYSIGTSPGATNVVGWTSVGLALEVTQTGNFPAGVYYFNVRAVNGAQLTSDVASSDGIQIHAYADPAEFTTPVIVGSSMYSCDNAMLSKAEDGGMHLVYQNALDSSYSNSKIVYRKRSAAGTWMAAEDVTDGTPTGTYPDVVEDSAGSVHVVYGNSLGREVMDIFERVKSGSSWNSALNLTNNNLMCWYPRLAASGAATYLAVNSGTTSSGQTVKSAVSTAGAWPTFSDLGTNSSRYGSPDIMRSPDGVIHGVWFNGSGLTYRKNAGSGWSSPVTIASCTAICMPRIACDMNNRPMVVWLGRNTGTYYEIYFSRYDGSAWTSPLKLGEGHYPVIAVDRNNFIHVAFTSAGVNGTDDILHIVNTGSGWSLPNNVSNNGGSSVRPALEIDNDGGVHVAWQDNTNGANQIMWAYAPPVGRPLAEAKALADGELVTITGCVVTAAFDGFFYVENSDRSAGIRVDSSASVTPGNVVTISGTISTVSGERRIVCPG